jgi:hypothetical protein
MRVHLGLGDARKVHALEIHWPSESVEKLRRPAPNPILTVDQGNRVTGELCVLCQREKD